MSLPPFHLAFPVRDLAEARYWYAAAARNGEPGADLKVQELDAKLTPKPSS